jgi:hypothetical protein
MVKQALELRGGFKHDREKINVTNVHPSPSIGLVFIEMGM